MNDAHALTSAAESFLQHESARAPDFSACLVLVPHLHAAHAFRQALGGTLRGTLSQPVMLPPRLVTLAEWAADAPAATALEPECVRLAVLHNFLERTEQVPRSALWQAAQELLDLLNELESEGAELPASWPSPVANNAHLSVEASIALAVWQALRGGERTQARDKARDMARRLEWLVERAAHPVYTLGLTALTGRERNFLARWSQRHPVIELPITAVFPARAALLHTAWDRTTPALARRAEEFAAQTPDSPLDGNLVLLAAPGPEPAAAAAEDILLRWLGEGMRQIAIVALDRLAARRLRALLERRDILVKDETGWTFSTAAASHVLDRWLNVVMDDAWYRDLLDLLKSPFIGAADRTRHEQAVQDLETAFRRHGAPDGLSGHIALAREQGKTEAVDLLTRLKRASALFPKTRLTLSDWTQRLLHSLEQIDALSALAADPIGSQLLALLEELARETAAHAARFPLQAWRRWLYLHLEQATFQDASVDSPIRLTHLLSTRLRTLEGVIVLGADARHLPAHGASGLFNDAARIQLGLPGAAKREAEMRAALADVLSQVPKVALIWQAEAVGEPLPLSPWLIQLDAFHRAAWGRPWVEDAPPAALPAFPPAAEPIPASAAHADAAPPRISVSAWQSLVDCPYRFFARHLLALNELDEVPEEMDKADYGSLVHAVLAEFHRSHPILSEYPPDALERALVDLTQHTFSAVESRNYLAGAWRMRWQRRLPAYVAWALAWETSGYRFLSAETPVSREVVWRAHEGASEKRITRLEGRADRMDDHGGALTVLDYKTQGKQALRKKLAADAEDIQLTAYAWMTDAEEAGFVSLDDDKIEVMARKEGLAEAAEKESQRLVRALADMEAGAPLPAHGADSTCQYCEMRGLCRREYA